MSTMLLYSVRNFHGSFAKFIDVPSEDIDVIKRGRPKNRAG